MTDNAPIRRSRTENFEHTISGLLERRVQLLHASQELLQQASDLKADILAIDRVLASLGYQGNANAKMPKRRRNVLFGPGELSRAILDELRTQSAPRTSRDIARAVLPVGDLDPADNRTTTNFTRRISKFLRMMKNNGMIESGRDGVGNMTWQLVPRASGGM